MPFHAGNRRADLQPFRLIPANDRRFWRGVQQVFGEARINLDGVGAVQPPRVSRRAALCSGARRQVLSDRSFVFLRVCFE